MASGPSHLPHGDLRLPAPLRRLLTAVVGGFVALTVAGVVVLWPPPRASGIGQAGRPDLGTPVQLVDATVTAAPVVACRSALPGVALICRAVCARLDSGPAQGEVRTLDIPERHGQPDVRA